MIKFLHSADWHLGTTADTDESLREDLRKIPELALELCRRERCDLVLLAGDLLDANCPFSQLSLFKQALEAMAVPVFIAPGNHDPLNGRSPWQTGVWPKNVHIFTEHTSVSLPELDCRVYGAPFYGMDSPPLLRNFRAAQPERYAIGLFHGDPTQAASPCNPVTAPQVAASGLTYLALGHIHKRGQFTAGSTLCAWPGCPMGRGWDETGEKGFLLGRIDEDCITEFIPSGLPQFLDIESDVASDALTTLAALLPATESEDHYRVTLTGRCPPFSADELSAKFSHIPHLELRDRTLPPRDVWDSLGQDTLSGVLFDLLKQRHDLGDPTAFPAAELVHRLLNGEEVPL